MTSFALGVTVTLAVFGWAPRLHQWWTAHRMHRLWMDNYKPPEKAAEPFAPPIWHPDDLLTQELARIRPAAPMAERHWDTGEQPTIGMRLGFANPQRPRHAPTPAPELEEVS